MKSRLLKYLDRWIVFEENYVEDQDPNDVKFHLKELVEMREARKWITENL